VVFILPLGFCKTPPDTDAQKFSLPFEAQPPANLPGAMPKVAEADGRERFRSRRTGAERRPPGSWPRAKASVSVAYHQQESGAQSSDVKSAYATPAKNHHPSAGFHLSARPRQPPSLPAPKASIAPNAQFCAAAARQQASAAGEFPVFGPCEGTANRLGQAKIYIFSISSLRKTIRLFKTYFFRIAPAPPQSVFPMGQGGRPQKVQDTAITNEQYRHSTNS